MEAILPPHVDLDERLLLRCALGIRFRDTATGELVSSGLTVKAYPAKARESVLPLEAKANHSGVWLFHGLAAARLFELGAEEHLNESGSPPHPPQFHIEVVDKERRFLPMTLLAETTEEGPMRITLPPAFKGSDVPLFSAPERSLPAGCAVVRTHLVAATSDEPHQAARWAVLRATTTIRGTPKHNFGLSNHKGDVALIFPWPELTSLTATSSPPAGASVEGQSWELQFSVWHNPTNGEADFADFDDLRVRIAGNALTLSTDTSPPEDFSSAMLQYRRELVVPELPETSPPSQQQKWRALIINH